MSKEKFEELIIEKYPDTYDLETKIIELGDGLQSNLDKFYEKYCKIGRNFECLYYEHISDFGVSRCKDCGTVIFVKEDDDFCISDWRCPICVEHKIFGFEYWTKEQIEQDEIKQNTIELYAKMKAQQDKDDERYKKTGLYNFQLFKKEFVFGMNFIVIEISTSYSMEINFSKKKDKDSIFYTEKFRMRIPLSPRAFYSQFIYKHTGKCHPDLRSKWFIGKPVEITWKAKEEEN